MENQYNLPENNLSVSSVSKKKLLIAVLVVVFLLVIVFLAAFSLGLRNGSLKSKNTVKNEPVTEKAVNPVVEKNTNSTVGEQDPEIVGRPAVGAETEATPEERKALGIPDFQKIKVTQRNDQGRILSYKVETNSGDLLDSDNDGIPDKKELEYGTDPNKLDTDGDDISDYQELTMGTDPKVMNDFSTKK